MLQAFSAVPTDIEDFLEKHQSRTLLRFVTIGSVAPAEKSGPRFTTNAFL